MTVDNIPPGEPYEIAARGVFKVLTEEISSRGESPRGRTRLSVVRGKGLDDPAQPPPLTQLDHAAFP